MVLHHFELFSDFQKLDFFILGLKMDMVDSELLDEAAVPEPSDGQMIDTAIDGDGDEGEVVYTPKRYLVLSSRCMFTIQI